MGRDICLFGELCCKRFRYFPISKVPADILAIIVILLTRKWFYAVASMEIHNSDPLASQTTFRHDRVDNMREIP
jgi:hypothetical protein